MHIEAILPTHPMEELERNKKLAEQELSRKRSGKGQRKQVNKSKSMKWSPILHGVSAIAGILGVLVLLGWWIVLAKTNGFSLLFTPEHMYDDAIALLLVSIAFGIGTLIHQRQEQQ